jgi:hypothetical protein
MCYHLTAMTIRVAEYVRADGTSPFGQWYDRLDATAAAKVTTALLRLEQGNTSNVKWFSGIGEYVIHWGQATASTWPRTVRHSSSRSPAAPSGASSRTSPAR